MGTRLRCADIVIWLPPQRPDFLFSHLARNISLVCIWVHTRVPVLLVFLTFALNPVNPVKTAPPSPRPPRDFRAFRVPPATLFAILIRTVVAQRVPDTTTNQGV